MNRFQFLAEMRKGLLKTAKEVSVPLLKDEIDKIEQVTDQIVGVSWIKLDGVTPNSFSGVQERYINKQSILLLSDGAQLKAFGKLCESCHSLAQWISFDKKLKCFTCDKTFDVELESGNLTCKRYYIKEKGGEWFIGV